MSSSSTSSSTIRKAPNYKQDPYVNTFKSIEEFDHFVKNDLYKHANFLITRRKLNSYNEPVHYYNCNHASTPRIHKSKKDASPPPKKRKIVKPSIKVNCKARCTVTYRPDNSVFIIYYWRHENHDPLEIEKSSRKKAGKEVPVASEALDKKHQETDSLSSLFDEAAKSANKLLYEIKKCDTDERKKLMSEEEIEKDVCLLKHTLTIFEKIGKHPQRLPSRQS